MKKLVEFTTLSDETIKVLVTKESDIAYSGLLVTDTYDENELCTKIASSELYLTCVPVVLFKDEIKDARVFDSNPPVADWEIALLETEYNGQNFEEV